MYCFQGIFIPFYIQFSEAQPLSPLDFRTHWTVNSEFWIRNSESLGNCTSKSI